MVSRAGGKTRHTKVHVRAPANDMNKSKLSVIIATDTEKKKVWIQKEWLFVLFLANLYLLW